MMLPARALIIPLLLLAFLCIETNSQAQSSDKSTDGVISGKVTIKGKPAAGILIGVRLARAELASPTYKAATNQDGTYRISVPGGSYHVAPVAPALVLSDVNNPRGQGLVVTEGDNAEGIDFDLIRGGVITGRITDADGRPLIEHLVSVAVADSKQPVAYSEFSGSTDDRGIYRIFGIRPGRYKVSAGSQTDYFARKAGRQPLPLTYYPDVTEINKAAIVDIDEGTEAANIDIKLGPPFQGYSASGRIVDETGAPVANVTVGLSRVEVIDANNTSSSSEDVEAASDKQGEFRLKNLRNGKYEISLDFGEKSDLRPEQSVSFDVRDQDVTGLVVRVSRGATVSGVVVLETPKSDAARALLSRAYIQAYVRNERQGTMAGTSEMKGDGSFFVGGLLPGMVSFSVGLRNGGERGLNIARVERDGVAQPNGFQVQRAERVTGIRIVLAYSTGVVRGVIKLENGTLPPDGRLVVQLIKSDDPGFGQGGVQADQRGRFLFEGLAAGTYEVRVSAYVPGAPRRPPTARQTVTVSDNATTEVMITLDLAAGL